MFVLPSCVSFYQVVLSFKEDANIFKEHMGWSAEEIGTIAGMGQNLVDRSKITKCECKILKKRFSDGLDAEKRADSCVKAKEELEMRPWMLDFSQHVHPNVRELYTVMVNAGAAALESKK